ncbi:MAG TPA: aminotransferase class V-fold PLP-dependent enzyme [Pyrinomonadaceae bacterium]|jgi:kynureninase|nr:aminotransferase class V-fold PLP-dependent enzyme [Pyrinomonadaceae bacterium]
MRPRKQDFLLPDGTYLLSHSVGCLPRAAREAADDFFGQWGALGGEAWDGWLASIGDFQQSLATLLNGEAAEFCPQANISSALAKILSSLPRRKGKTKLLLSELDFPSAGFALAQAERAGYTVEFIAADGDTSSIECWRRHLTPDTQLVLVTHVLYGNSRLNPVAEVIACARRHEVFTLVDVAQSAGVVPIDLRAWGADFVVGSSIKWLCGGPGAGFLWVNPSGVARFEPTDVGWFSHEDPFEFRIQDFRYASDARRFWGGTPSVLPYVIARASIDVINGIGVENVRAHNQSLTDRLVRVALERGLTVLTPQDPARRGGTVCVAFPDPQRVYQQLKEAKVFVDVRPSYGVRFSPHIYNDVEDIDHAVACFDAAA